MIALREARLDQIKQEMDDLTVQITGSLAASPDDFDGRERMWMRREDLRAERAELAAARPTLGERITERLFSRCGTPSVGTSMALVLFIMPS